MPHGHHVLKCIPNGLMVPMLSGDGDPYVDGPRATRVFQGLIGSLASICPAY